jgi:hypothetical protein
MKTISSVAMLCTGVALAGCNSMGTSTNTSTTASKPAMASTPAADKLAPPAGAKFVKKIPAIGVQIYKCALNNGQPTWTFVAPEADLFDEAGKRIGRHGAGPFWELNDGSKVVGTVAQRADAPRPDAIPHLLLTTKSSGGAGMIADVTHLQRINTISGVAPTSGCGPGDIDKQARVLYTADYLLFAAK